MMQFGGTPKRRLTLSNKKQPKMADTTLLQFSKSILPVPTNLIV